MLPDDAERSLTEWLRAELDPTIETVEVARLADGQSSGAWRLCPVGGAEARPLVLKAPTQPSPAWCSGVTPPRGTDPARRPRPLRPAPRQGSWDFPREPRHRQPGRGRLAGRRRRKREMKAELIEEV